MCWFVPSYIEEEVQTFNWVYALFTHIRMWIRVFPRKSRVSLIICLLLFGCGISCGIVVQISLFWLLAYILQHKWGNNLLASVWNCGIVL